MAKTKYKEVTHETSPRKPQLQKDKTMYHYNTTAPQNCQPPHKTQEDEVQGRLRKVTREGLIPVTGSGAVGSHTDIVGYIVISAPAVAGMMIHRVAIVV